MTLKITAEPVVVSLPPLVTQADVLYRAAELVEEQGVKPGGQSCVLTRLAQAHEELFGDAVAPTRTHAWAVAGQVYFGDGFDHIYTTNDHSFCSKARTRKANNRRRARWAAQLLRERARELERG